jgi:uncharacterized membrane protein YdjX (TVP38/TMEM64 family)
MLNPRIARIVMLCVLLCLVAVTGWFLFGTEQGNRVLHHPTELGGDVRQWSNAHPFLAPLAVIGLYVLLTPTATMPIWWIQMLAGFAFGVLWGTLWCVIGATAGATLTVLLSRWLAGDVFHKQIEPKMVKLRRLDEKLGHNGLLVVMVARLLHIVPFGLSNFMFGLIGISVIDVALGTALGNLPTILMFVKGASDWRSLRDPRFIAGMVILHVFLLTPLVLRYLRPQWFKKIGVE